MVRFNNERKQLRKLNRKLNGLHKRLDRKPLFLGLAVEIINPKPRLLDDVKIF